MMNSFVIAVIIICGALVLVFAALSMYWWRQVRAIQTQMLAMQTQQQQVTDTAVTVGRKLLLLQKDLHTLVARINAGDTANNEYKAYNQAASLLAQGAKLDEVIEQCHLTRGEAELLASMHRAAQGERPT